MSNPHVTKMVRSITARNFFGKKPTLPFLAAWRRIGCNGLSKIYTFDPHSRAEHSNNRALASLVIELKWLSTI
jgi:hypothetical protein